MVGCGGGGKGEDGSVCKSFVVVLMSGGWGWAVVAGVTNWLSRKRVAMRRRISC